MKRKCKQVNMKMATGSCQWSFSVRCKEVGIFIDTGLVRIWPHLSLKGAIKVRDYLNRAISEIEKRTLL